MEQYKLPNLINREKRQNKINRALKTSELYRDPPKMNRASGTCGTITEDLASVSSELYKGGERAGLKKVLKVITAEILPNLPKT